MSNIAEWDDTRTEINSIGEKEGIVCLENHGEHLQIRGRYLPRSHGRARE